MRLSMLQRLCWMELQRGWVMLASGLLLPPLAVIAQYIAAKHHLYLPAGILMCLLALAVPIWANIVARQSQKRQSFNSIHFPLSPTTLTISTFLLQGILAVCIGLSTAWWSALNSSRFSLLIPLVILTVVSNFAVTFAATLILPSWVGLVIGLCWTLENTVSFSGLLSGSNSLPESVPFPVVLYLGTVITMSAIATIIFLLPARLSLWARRVLACLALGSMPGLQLARYAGILFLPLMLIPHLRQTGLTDIYVAPPMHLTSSDGSLAVDGYLCKVLPTVQVELRFADHQRQRSAVQHIAGWVRPIGFMGRDALLLARQREDACRIDVLNWSIGKNRIQPVGFLPAEQKVLVTAFPITMSPDGRYGLLGVHSDFDAWGSDLWRIDVQRRTVTLLQPAVRWVKPNIGWRADDLILTGDDGPRVLSMVTGRFTPLQLPQLHEAQR